MCFDGFLHLSFTFCCQNVFWTIIKQRNRPIRKRLDLTWCQPGAILVSSLFPCIILNLKRFSLVNIETGLCFDTVEIARFSVCWSINWSKLDQPKMSIIFQWAFYRTGPNAILADWLIVFCSCVCSLKLFPPKLGFHRLSFQ